jgi:hypothetical protein
MQTSLDRLTATVAKYTTSHVPCRHLASEEKEAAAKSMGLRLLTTDGSFAMVVAEHPEMPGVVVKVVPKDDKYAKFAKWMLEQEEQPTCFPRIDAAVDLPSACMVVAEKIAHGVDECDDEVEYVDERLQDLLLADSEYEHLEGLIGHTQKLREEVGGRFDSHARNFMRREDGTLVFIDPLW